MTTRPTKIHQNPACLPSAPCKPGKKPPDRPDYEKPKENRSRDVFASEAEEEEPSCNCDKSKWDATTSISRSRFAAHITPADPIPEAAAYRRYSDEGQDDDDGWGHD